MERRSKMNTGLTNMSPSHKLTRFPQAHSTIVPPSSLCPPRRWSGAGMGVGMLRGTRDSLTWKKFLGFLVILFINLPWQIAKHGQTFSNIRPMIFPWFSYDSKIHQAHSFPPSSLDRRSTELIVSPKKVVGCRGGSRNVEGYLILFSAN